MARSRRLDDVARHEAPVVPRIERASTDVAVTRGHRPETPSGPKERHPDAMDQDSVETPAGQQRMRAFSQDEEGLIDIEPDEALAVVRHVQRQVRLDPHLVSTAMAYLRPSSGEPLLTHWHMR